MKKTNDIELLRAVLEDIAGVGRGEYLNLPRKKMRDRAFNALLGFDEGRMKKTTGTYDKRSARIGFQEWNLDAMNEYEKLLKAILKEGLEIATTEAKCSAWLSIEWAGPGIPGGTRRAPPADPTTIHVELPIGPSEDESPRWEFHLSELIQSMIELNEEGDGGPITGEQRESFAAVRDDLRRLADEIDAALNREE